MIANVYDELCDSLVQKLKEYNCTYILQKLDLLKVLHGTNSCNQRYHFLEHEGDFVFFCEYRLKMNILTYAKLSLKIPVRMVGIPCSVSSSGYAASSPRMLEQMFSYLSSFNGATIVINASDEGDFDYFAKGETLPTHVINIRWKTMDQYLSDMRSGYRYRIRKALNKLNNVEVKKIDNGMFGSDLYSLYKNVFNKSEYKLEKLPLDFFRSFGEITAFYDDGIPRGFIQTYYSKQENKLYFLFCGLDYSYNKIADLYYLMIYKVVSQGVEQGCNSIDLGQTTTDAKCKFAAVTEKRYMYVTHGNKIIRRLICNNIDKFSYNEKHLVYNVMKSEGETDENTTYTTKTP